MKVCKKCLIEKEDYMFPWYYVCKQCKKEASQSDERKLSKLESAKKYRSKNKDILNEKRRENWDKYKIANRIWKKENKDKIKWVAKIWYDKNREAINKKTREYYQNNKDIILPKIYEYKRNNPEKVKLWNKKDYINNYERFVLDRKIRKHKTRAVTDWTINTKSLKELMKNQNSECVMCKCELDIEIKYSVHLDHIIPISKWWLNTIWNVQYLCSKCNLSKSNH